MFTCKPWKEFATRVVLSVVIMFNALAPIGVSAKSALGNEKTARSTADNTNDIANSITLGNPDIPRNEQVPILSEEIAQQAQQEDKSIRFRVEAEPAIYVPGKPVQLNWKVQNAKSEALTLSNAEVVVHTPDGLTTIDASATYTQDGLLAVPLESKKQNTALSASKDAEFPMYIDVDLLVDDDLVATQTVMIDQPHFSVEKNKGGMLKAMDGKVEISVPSKAIDESLAMDIRTPAPQSLPGVSLTWQPLEIIAVGKDSQKNVHKFKAPLKIQLTYDETKIFGWDENALTIYYYDSEALDWFPIETTVDPENNTLTAYSDHLTVFDYKANNWQSQSLPTVDSFKVSDFTGAGTYAINLWTPPGQNGLQPSLTLSYNSQVIDESSAYSQASWVGLGWDLDTGAITRNMHGTDSDVSDDTFAISAGGVSGLLLPVSVNGTVTTYNTADQSFMKVEFNSASDQNKWTAWGKDGTKYEFASRAYTSKSNSCATQAQLDVVWRWSLTSVTSPRVRDANGNPIAMTYAYDIEQKSGSCYNQIAVYPLSISYPNGQYSVGFSTVARTDYQRAWTLNGSKTLFGRKRLNEIKIQHQGATVRRYVLTYAPNNSTNIYPNFNWNPTGTPGTDKTLTLVKVQEFASDAASPYLPAVTFTYGDSMHLTRVNNGQGGQVDIEYAYWQYLDDYNENVRSLFERFGHVNGYEQCPSGYSGLPSGWTKVGAGTVKCGADTYGYFNLGNYSTNPPQTGRTRHALPEHIAKPGGRYDFAINVSSQHSGSTTNVQYGVKDTSSGGGSTMNSVDVGYGFTSSRWALTIPATYNFANTQIEMYCEQCFINKVEFMLLPRYYRVTQRQVTVQPGDNQSTYTYSYDNAAPNTSDNSAAANPQSATLYTPIYREYRGNAMTRVVDPNGLATINWFHQSDSLKGRAYDTLVMKRDFQDDFEATTIDTANWTTTGTTHSLGSLFLTDFDSAIQSVAGASEISFSRKTASLTSGEIAVAHVRLSGASAVGKVGLTNGSQLLEITLQGNTATVGGNALLPAGNFIKGEWYGVMFIVDVANGSRIRIWQLDNPANFGETLVSGVGSGSWTFRDLVTNGTMWLDAYTEGVPYTETITSYDTTIQYNVTAVNNILPSSTVFQDLHVDWNTVSWVEQRNYNGDASYVGTRQTFTYAPASQFGNMLTQTDYENNNGTLSAHRGIKYEYYPNSTPYIVSLPARQVVLDCTGGSCDFGGLTDKVAETFNFYDNHGYDYTKPPTLGELKMQRVWVQNDDYTQISSGYDAHGNPVSQTTYTGYATATQTTDPAGAQITYTCYGAGGTLGGQECVDDGYHTYPTWVLNPLEQATQTGYDYRFGVPNSLTDPNGNVTTATYDGFGRLKTITAPLDEGPTLQVTYYDGRIPFQVDLIQRLHVNVDPSLASLRLSRFYDGAGRQVQTQKVGTYVNGEQKNVVTDYKYDRLGRQVKQSMPHSITYNAAPIFAAQDLTISTTTVYDILGRALSVTPPNQNDVTYAYSDLSTTMTDPKGAATTTTMDVWGRTVQVDAPEGPDVSYEYDVLDRLSQASRGGLITAVDYDGAGRKVGMDDPDMGTAGTPTDDNWGWVYEYDALGNLTLQTDARNCTLALAYDALNRLTAKTSSGEGCGQQVDNHYYYDSDDPATPEYDPVQADQKGYRTHMNDVSGSTNWTYDARGRLRSEVKTIDDQTYYTDRSYNSADMLSLVYYPDHIEWIEYGYNSDGSLKQIYSSQSSVMLHNMTRDEAGRVTSMNLGSVGKRQSFTYFDWDEPVQGGLLKTDTIMRLTDNIVWRDLAYTYDENANVETITDNLAGPQTQTFEYDSLNRLTSANVTGGTDGLYSESYAYDASTGNLSLKGGVSYTYDTAHPHAVQSLSNGNTYTYDPNGNMISRNVDGQLFDLSYDAEGRLVSVSSNQGAPEPTETPTLAPTVTNTPEVTLTPSPTSTSTPTATQTPQTSIYSSQPNGSAGIDTTITNLYPTTNFGTYSEMSVGEDNSATDSIGRSLLKFDLSSIPTNAVITSATLSLWTNSDHSGNARTIRVYRLKTSFDESQATWNISAAGTNWQAAGASGANDRESTDIGSIETLADEPLDTEKQITLDTGSVQELVNGTFTNNGFLLAADTELDDNFGYKTSDSSNSAQRPKLVIQYTLPQASAPGSSFHYASSRKSGQSAPRLQSSFPATAVLDDFNRADGAIGSNWAGSTSTYSISSNQLLVGSNSADIYWNPVSYGADQEAYFTFTQVSTSAPSQGLALKGQDGRILAVVYVASSSVVRVLTYSPEQGWVQRGADISVTFADGDQFGARAKADGEVEVYKNGTLLATRSVTAWPYYDQGGYIGLGFSSAQGARVDDFGGGNVSSGATSTPTQTPVVSDTPTETPTASATSTPTATFTPSLTPTITDTPTITPSPTATTPPVPVFMNASFVYDGDGRRVKSVVTTNLGTTTTHFVNDYYEVENGWGRKYYYADGQRIMMKFRSGSGYLILFSDHLGSNSLVVGGAGGGVFSEMRYKAWGEVRYAKDDLPAWYNSTYRYTYTGQYSHTDDFGLMYYNARWYDPSLGRFAQADTIIPEAQGVQAWDRYGYANNNPVRYADPTGHYIFEGGGCFVGIDCDPTASAYTGQLLRNVQGSDGRIHDKGPWTSVETIFLSPKAAEQIYGVTTPMRVTKSTLLDPTNEGFYMVMMAWGGALGAAGSSMPNWFGRSSTTNTVPTNLVDDVYSSGGWVTTYDDILMPGGKPIGTPGKNPKIRTVESEQQLRETFDALKVDGTPANKPGYEEGYLLPNGGFVGWRTSKKYGPTIDVNIPGFPEVKRIHLPK